MPAMTVPSVRRALSLLPPCATTGIGSLPHTQQELALQMALQVDVPYLPQLPAGNPSEYMIPSALDGLPGLTLDADGMCSIDLAAWQAQKEQFGLSIEVALQSGDLTAFEPSVQACRSWKPFLWEVEARKLAFAKVQLAGPGTVRWVAKTNEGAPVSEHHLLDQQIFRLLLAKALAMAKAVRKAGATPILFLDEPGMFAFNRTNPRHLLLLQELKLLAMAVQREGALVGVHCCSNTEWGLLLDLGLDLLSIDVRLSLDAVLEERVAFRRFLSTGATLSLGVVPTDMKSAFEVGELVDSVEASLRATLPRGTPFAAVASRMPLTPACGLAMRSVLDAERTFEQVRDAQRLMLRAVASDGVPAAGPAPN